MHKLTRAILDGGSLRERLAMPAHLSWSDEEIELSLQQVLASRPVGGLWIFAYGSLIWNPLLAFEEQQVARLEGWRRSFCIRSISARGTPEHPGRVLGLEKGGHTMGVAYRIADSIAITELRTLWSREMSSGVYFPVWETALLANGKRASAVVFVANPGQSLYENDGAVSTVAQLAAKASGVFGTNAEYITNLASALRTRNMVDEYVFDVAQQLAKLLPTA